MLQKFDERNKDLMVYVKDGLYHRDEAKVSVFDSVVQGGDAVWEGLRVYNGGIFCLDRHLERLQHSAKAMAFADVPANDWIKSKIFETLKANNMTDDVHIRLTLTRGEKITSGMDPRLNNMGSCLIVLPEYKPPVYDNDHGITVFTSSIRRNSPMHVDSKIHHANLINNILAKIQSNVAGKDAALMLDAYGFASELNGTNIFMVSKGILYTPFADACLHGITRGLVMELAGDIGVRCYEKNLSLTELYNADGVFCTGTMGELTPIVEIDGRKITVEKEIFNQLLNAFDGVKEQYCVYE
jgi:branched-chain amino acid aminotransferase